MVNQKITLNTLIEILPEIDNGYSYTIYVLVLLLINAFSLWVMKFLGNDSLQAASVVSIESANDAFLPSYLGYFFVALSVNDLQMFLFVFGIISIFIFFSRISYFNPILFLYGYHFYYVVTESGVKILVISKMKLKKREDAEFQSLKRINDYTFIDVRGKR